jgi:hypothetical protein
VSRFGEAERRAAREKNIVRVLRVAIENERRGREVARATLYGRCYWTNPF